MKIGNSVIQFKLSCKSHPCGCRCTMSNVPYWSVYAQHGDTIDETWHPLTVFTYDEIVQHLQQIDAKRVLVAYPRFSRKIRRTYIFYYFPADRTFAIMDKHIGEVLYEADERRRICTYLSTDYKSSYYFDKFFFINFGNGYRGLTSIARDKINEAQNDSSRIIKWS